MQEQWATIEGFNGLYEVSSFGRVRSRAQVLKPQKESHGYASVSLSKNGVRKSYKIHRLVAKAFVPNPEGKTCVNHIDGNKKNNAAENLEWVTQQENNRHSWAIGLNRNTAKQRETARIICRANNSVMQAARRKRGGNG